jgi:hypothetical protein
MRASRLTFDGLALFAFVAGGCFSTEGYRRDPDVAGAAGTTGGAGTTGAAGSTGAAGTAAMAGTTGAAGVVASAGTSGAAARGGTTGAAGTTSTSGSAGTTATTGRGGSGSGTGGTAASGTTLFMDNFETGNPLTSWLSGDKEAGQGTWSVATDGSKVFQGVASSGDFTIQVNGDTRWTDYSVEADLKVTSGSGYEVAIYGRFTTFESFYIMMMDDVGQVQVRRRLNGSTTTLGAKWKPATEPAIGTKFRFKLEFRGTTINAYVDGVMRVSTSDTMLPSGGIGIGVSQGTAQFDNVVVTR